MLATKKCKISRHELDKKYAQLIQGKLLRHFYWKTQVTPEQIEWETMFLHGKAQHHKDINSPQVHW